MGIGNLPWSIEGDTPIKSAVCSDRPRFSYNVVADPAKIVAAAVKHIIWHKVPMPDATFPMPGAIERVLVDADVDYATKKTPQHSTFVPEGFQLPTGNSCFGTCFLDFCSKGWYMLLVQVVWRDTSDQSVIKQFQEFPIDATQ